MYLLLRQSARAKRRALSVVCGALPSAVGWAATDGDGEFSVVVCVV